MKRILLPVLIIGLIIVSIFFARPLAQRLLNREASSETTSVLESIISVSPAAQLSIIQGFSDQAMVMQNISDKSVKVNLSHTHGFLTLTPKSETLAPGASREINMYVDDLCPSGEIELLVFFLAEVEGHAFEMETFELEFNVLPGDLRLAREDNQFIVTWNNDPAPPGVILYYRDPEVEEERWLRWGETPQLNPPTHFQTDNYTFDFKAKLGEIESVVERFEIYIEGISSKQPEIVTKTAGQKKPAETEEEAEEIAAPEIVSTADGMTHRVGIIAAPENIKEPAKILDASGQEERKEWWQSD